MNTTSTIDYVIAGVIAAVIVYNVAAHYIGGRHS